MTLPEVNEFFCRYRDAFNRLDGDAVADLWHSSSGIADSGAADGGARLTWWPEDAPMRANLRALCQRYRSHGYGRADFRIEQHLPLGPRHAFAHLHWTLMRGDGRLLQQFHTGYQLMRTAAGPRVLLAVAHEEDLQALGPGRCGPGPIVTTGMKGRTP
jgi:hypothetical protein